MDYLSTILRYPYTDGGTGCFGHGYCTNYAIRWAGYIYAPNTGTYYFYSSSDDASAITINRQLVTNDWIWHGYGTFKVGSIYLYGGKYYHFMIEFAQGVVDAGFTIEWEGPGISRQAVNPGYVS